MIVEPQLKEEYGIIEFLNLFTEDYCKDYLTDIVYPNGEIACPHCGNMKVYFLGQASNYRYRCADKLCRKDFTILKPTIFWNTKMPLRQWFFIIYQMSSNKKNISSIQTARDMSITQKSAWLIKTKVRYQLKQDDLILKGIVEIDEAFISKSKKNRYINNWGGISTRKAPIIGLIERGGLVVVKKIPNRNKSTLNNLVKTHVEKGSIIYTDAWHGYNGLNKLGYHHDFVNHSHREYVRDCIHTNSIEGFWSFLKRNIRSAHHSVSDLHLQSYIDEAVFKYNNRHLTQMERFNMILKRCITL